jgi:hypothetical protein
VSGFYEDLRAVGRRVTKSSAEEAAVERMALDCALDALRLSARRLADSIRSYPLPENPGILYDGYEGEWEETAFVPVRMASTAKAAKQAIPAVAKQYAREEPGFYLLCSHRCFLAPSEYSHGEEDWRYSHCREHDAGAIEFWRVEIAERRLSLRRKASNLKLGIRAYRRQRKQGVGRWKASFSLRLHLGPQLIRMARFRWNRWQKRRAATPKGQDHD